MSNLAFLDPLCRRCGKVSYDECRECRKHYCDECFPIHNPFDCNRRFPQVTGKDIGDYAVKVTHYER